MHRRNFIKGMALAAACPLCTAAARADMSHWGYDGEAGPEHWGALADANKSCVAGAQQSPINLTGATHAELALPSMTWDPTGAKMINNGHTLQVNLPQGGTLKVGPSSYNLVQYHFHAPGEHLVDGKRYPMEVHFVHKKVGTGGLGVLGLFLVPGAPNATFAELAKRFPSHEGDQSAVDDVNPADLLPTALQYWRYEGSLTTPPCSEIVDWMVLETPLNVAASDIAKFTALYDRNARPVAELNRRFVLVSQ